MNRGARRGRVEGAGRGNGRARPERLANRQAGSEGLIDRLADSLGWRVQTAEQFDKDAKFLLKKGYNLIGPVRKRALATP